MALKLSGTSGGLRIKGSGGSMRIKVEPTSFTLLSTDFSVYYTGNAIVASDTSGFVNLYGGGGVNNLVNNCYTLDGGSPSIAGVLNRFWSEAGLTTGYMGYIFYVTWGPGSTVTDGLARVAWAPSSRVLISPVDPTDPTALAGSSNAAALAGTFNLPATFRLYKPVVSDGTSWC